MLRVGETITINSSDGHSLAINTATLKAGPQLQPALTHLLAGGDPSMVSQDQLEGLAGKTSLIGSGTNALIVRFDLKIIRIDESTPIDLGKMTWPGPGGRQADPAPEE
jgi:hypothetical protein